MNKKTLNKWLRKAVHNSGWDRKDTKCFISGKTNDLEAHHSKASFAFIVANSLNELNLPYHKYIDEYDTEELSQIKAEVLKEHREKAVNITIFLLFPFIGFSVFSFISFFKSLSFESRSTET